MKPTLMLSLDLAAGLLLAGCASKTTQPSAVFRLPQRLLAAAAGHFGQRRAGAALGFGGLQGQQLGLGLHREAGGLSRADPQRTGQPGHPRPGRQLPAPVHAPRAAEPHDRGRPAQRRQPGAAQRDHRGQRLHRRPQALRGDPDRPGAGCRHTAAGTRGREHRDLCRTGGPGRPDQPADGTGGAQGHGLELENDSEQLSLATLLRRWTSGPATPAAFQP